MKRFLFPILLAVAATGCATEQKLTVGPQDVTPTPELAKLGRMIGTWKGTAEMISPGPEEMKKIMMEAMGEGMQAGMDMEEMPTSFAGGGTISWTLGGSFMKNEGWHEMGPGLTAELVEYTTWDASAGHYRSWYFSSGGEFGEGTWKLQEDGSILVSAKGHDAEGAMVSGSGTMSYLDDDTIKWTWSENRGGMQMEMEGMSQRQ